MRINHAVLHIFDFESGVNVISAEELDLTSKQAKRFVEKHLGKVRADAGARRASFQPESAFAEEVKRYFFGQRDFMGLSGQIAEFLGAELGRADRPKSCDLLVADFVEEDDAIPAADGDGFDAPWDDSAAGPTAALAEPVTSRYFAILLLESKLAFMHEVGSENGAPCSRIARHHAILPNPSQKVASFAVIDARSLRVAYADKARKIDGQDTLLLPDGLLMCGEGVSCKEAIAAVERIGETVAEEYGANAAVAVAEAKARLAEDIEEGESFSPEELGREVFADKPDMAERFVEEASREQLPERVEVERRTAPARASLKHKIVTDTGIEVTFPSEYYENSDYIQFSSTPDGLISIELKNIGSIENR